MANTATKLPIKTDEKNTTPQRGLSTFDSLRSEIDRLFDDFTPSFWHRPFARLPFDKAISTTVSPAVDLIERDNGYEITAELPGIEASNIEVKVTNGILAVSAEKQETKEEKGKEYHLSERRYGALHRAFQLPPGVDSAKIDASFTNGVLTVKLPKSNDALKSERKIPIKAG
ncbi:Hsp20/alpha crystallin family protein [Rhizobium laguerreae]|uniref:Hsp20/alpha crystallin family protein n=1 Tax=Rhizobium laguerreae TaxID=1076926 RepID=UPI001C9286D4|nr:Hsp20/alpha crystallin family protein [Rhizobium laguerreae]MBY3095211.1 Hsp20/alpha crystallin family protein [Rhizobium laguerreae]